MIRFYTYSKDKKTIQRILGKRLALDDSKLRAVAKIVKSVQDKGDAALLEFSARFDGVTFKSARNLIISESALKKAWQSTPLPIQNALKTAAERIRAFHKKQIPAGWSIIEENGIRLEQRFIPLESVGVYVPGGIAAYPSSVLMNVIPAQIAGVERIVMVTPPLKGKSSYTILAAAHLLGIKEIYQVGGAQAVAALAFGTRTIPRVDKVVGPGNIYVACAKRLLYGIIDIDMFAGPSEIMVVADSSVAYSFIVADMLSQAEHDPEAVAIAVIIGALKKEMFMDELSRQLKTAPRRDIITKSLKANGMVIQAPDRKTALALINLKSPEHLELMVRDPEIMAKKVRNAGAVFLGQFTPEVIGDYVAGPNHTLPTGGTARFFSPLSVFDFIKMNHVVDFSEEAFMQYAGTAEILAECETLFAHANAVKIRKRKC